MVNKLDITALMGAVREQIERGTHIPCYDAVPQNAAAPLYYIELSGISSNDTKTMFCETYTVTVHAIARAEESRSRQGIYDMMSAVREALTDFIELPKPYQVVFQSSQGMNTLKGDESGEFHAVLPFDFRICYGFKVKGVW